MRRLQRTASANASAGHKSGDVNMEPQEAIKGPSLLVVRPTYGRSHGCDEASVPGRLSTDSKPGITARGYILAAATRF